MRPEPRAKKEGRPSDEAFCKHNNSEKGGGHMSAEKGQHDVKNRQAWWQWWLPYLGGVAGFLALMGSLIIFTVSKSIEIYKQTTYKEKVTVISYESQANGLFLNSGSGEVFLSHMMIECPDVGIEMVDPLNSAVKPKEFLHINPQKEPPSDSVLANVSDAEWEEVLDAVATGANRYKGDGKEYTLKLSFIFSDDAALRLYKSTLGAGLRTLKAGGGLVYYSANLGERLEQPVPLEGIIYRQESKPNGSLSPPPR
jgi:hypothetical protein